MPIRSPVLMANVAGVISDNQHGARTGPNDAHELADITGLAAHAARHNAGGVDALAADAAAATASLRTLGSGAAQAAAGNHAHTRVTEAKIGTGGANPETFTWTTAFAATPAVTASANTTNTPRYFGQVTSSSTTGATVQKTQHDGTDTNAAVSVIAQEPT